PDALQHPFAFSRGDPAGAHEMADAALLQAEGLPARFLAPDAYAVPQDTAGAGSRRLSHRPERHPPEIRRRGDRRPGGSGSRRARAGQLPQPRPEGACPRDGQAPGRVSNLAMAPRVIAPATLRTGSKSSIIV